MAASFRSSTTNGGTTGTAATGNRPSGTTDGDVLIAVVTSAGSGTTVSAVPSGWALVQNDPNPADFSIWTYWKLASSEPASWDWTLSAAGTWRVDVLAYSGGHQTTPINTSSAEQAAAVNSLAVGAITTTVDDCVIVTVGSVDASGGARTWSSDGTTNERIDSALNGLQLGIYDEVLASAGSITRTVTVTGTAQDLAGHIIAIAPVPPASFDPATQGGGLWPEQPAEHQRAIVARWFVPEGAEGFPPPRPTFDLQEQPAEWRVIRWYSVDPPPEGLVPLATAYSGFDLEEQPGLWRPLTWFRPDDATEGLPPPLAIFDLAEQPASWRAPRWTQVDDIFEGFEPPPAPFDPSPFDWSEQPTYWTLTRWYSPEDDATGLVPVAAFDPTPHDWQEQPTYWTPPRWFQTDTEAIGFEVVPPVVFDPAGGFDWSEQPGQERDRVLVWSIVDAPIEGFEPLPSVPPPPAPLEDFSGGGGGPGQRRKKLPPIIVPVVAKSMFEDMTKRYGYAKGRDVYFAMEREHKGPFAPGKKYGPKKKRR